VKPADWPEGKNWGTLSIDASCIPADITYPTDLKLLNEARESSERIIDDLCKQSSDLRKHRPRYDRGRARAAFLIVAKQKRPRWSRIKAAIRSQLDYVRRNLDAIDALIASGARLSGLKTHWWQKLLVISELHHQQSILLNADTRSMPNRIVNLVQRHVRPIVRGKARAAVEFGAKISVSVRNGFPFLHRISWDPYNESEDLISQANKYKGTSKNMLLQRINGHEKAAIRRHCNRTPHDDYSNTSLGSLFNAWCFHDATATWLRR
jgi:hypothetical protein